MSSVDRRFGGRRRRTAPVEDPAPTVPSAADLDPETLSRRAGARPPRVPAAGVSPADLELTLPPEGRAALRGGIFGNYVDQLHIFLPLVALAPALPTLAGPHALATTGAVVVMAMLLGRPVGGMVFGQIADRLGRTATTKIAIAGTAACTFGIAAVPTHEVIGGAAIAVIIALRFLGGVFIAGEYSAAIPLAMEWSKPNRRGLFSGLIMSMAPWAQATIAFVTAILLIVLGPTAYAGWGWRMSFAAGGVASVLMLLYYRRHVTDAPIFLASRRPDGLLSQRGEASGGLVSQRGEGPGGLLSQSGEGLMGKRPAQKLGLVEVLTGAYASAFWQMFGLMTGLWFLTNTTVIMLTPRLATDVGLQPTQVSVVMGLAAIGQAIVMGVTGHLSTFTGRRRFFIIWGILALVSAPLLWLAIMSLGEPSGPTPPPSRVALIALCAIGLQVLTVTAYGPIGAYLSERLPTAVRSTGYGTAYSLSIVIPALYPFYLPTLESLVGRNEAVLGLMILGALLVAFCGGLGPALRPADIAADLETVASRQVKERA